MNNRNPFESLILLASLLTGLIGTAITALLYLVVAVAAFGVWKLFTG